MKWLRANGWRIAQLAVLAWIAIELHRVGDMVNESSPTTSLDAIAGKLGEVAERIRGVGVMMPSR